MRSRRRALATLGITLALLALLGLIGLDVESHLSPTSLAVPGTPSSAGEALAKRYFGDSSPFVVLLRGPAASIERQGPRLAGALRRRLGATAITPWDRAAPAGLRPDPDSALLLLDFHLPLPVAMSHTVPRLEAVLERQIHPPLRVTQSGYASVTRGLQSESLRATERAELIAAPLLILVLLFVFRSLAAAAIPLLFGAMTVLAGRGILVLLSHLIKIDALAVVVCSMMGLALGVDYSLLIVSRFREELDRGRDPLTAARLTRASAGRTTVFAGSTLFLSIFFSAFLQPGSLLASLAAALATVTAISVAIAWFPLPALLTLLGPRINAGRIPPRPSRTQPARKSEPSSSRVAAAARLALRRPALSAALIAAPLVLLALPALAFNTGAPGVDELPPDSRARSDAELIDDAAGPGWEAPFVLIAATDHGPITTARHLGQLARWQHRLADQPAVREVLGPAPIAGQAARLERVGETLASSGPGGPAGLARLGPGLQRSSAAVGHLRSGLAAAAAGSGLIGQGTARAERGAGLLAAGLDRAHGGARRASAALDRLASGSGRLADAQNRVAAAALSLSLGLRGLLPSLRGVGLAHMRTLRAELRAAADSDPAFRSEASQAEIVLEALESTRRELRSLRSTAIAINGAMPRLASGSEKLNQGSQRLADAAAASGLSRLGGGAEELASGLGALHGGAEALRGGLEGGYRRSSVLQGGLRRAGGRVSSETRPLLRGARSLERHSPRFAHSGYLALSALDGASPRGRATAAESVALDRGGGAARLLVVSDQPFNTEGSRQVGARLRASAARFSRRTGLRTAIAGGTAVLNDYGAATKARLPLVIGTIIALTFLILLLILRAPLIAALAVGLNLLSVAAAIGVLSLICKIPAGYPLGGHPYIDTVGAGAIFGVTFGLSIDYAFFLLARMRESYDKDGDNRAAISFGLEKTAGVITGAAAIMAAVFVSFAAAPIATVSQMGVGLTVAILLDATLVRIVLLPALMLLLGDRVWRVPARLERLLPNLALHGTEAST